MDGTLKALKSFTLVDAAAGRWRGQRGPVMVLGEDGKFKSTVGIANMAAKRDKFLKYTKISEDERRERAEKRAAAAERVRKALKRQDLSHVIERPLRRFGLKMMIIAMEHTYSKKLKQELITRRMIVIQDNLKWDKFHDYITKAINGKSKAGYSFCYIALNGKQVDITSRQTLGHWMDEMWAMHPPTLHVFENDTVKDKSIDQGEQIAAIFKDYDKDSSGTISLNEMTDLIIEMDLTTLGVSSEDITNYVNEEFMRADKDNSGEIDFDEFVEYFESLQTFLKDKLTIDSKHIHM